MITEILTKRTEEVQLQIASSRLDAIRTQAVAETAVRVYRDGAIGVASAIGDADPDALAEQAAAALQFEIPYPPPTDPAVSHTVQPGSFRDTDALVALTTEVLDTLRGDFPGFVFSHKVTSRRTTLTCTDNVGRDLRDERVSCSVGLIIKERGSANIFDTFFAEDHPELTAAGFLAGIRAHLTAFQQPATLPEADADGKHTIVMMGLGSTLAQPLHRHLGAQAYGSGASMFAGKLGEKLFSDKLTVHDSRDWARFRCCPFDAEGTLRADPSHTLVDRGVLAGIAASRRDAARFGLPATGSALGGMGSTPQGGVMQLDLVPTAPDLAALLGGKPGVLVWMEGGGDITRTGAVGAPASVLLRVDPTGKPVGRLSPATLTGDLYTILGDDLIGITEQTISPYAPDRFTVTRMAIQG